MHCVKSVRIWSYSGPRFSAFGLNTERYKVSLNIQSKWRKMRTRITSNTDTFYTVIFVIYFWDFGLIINHFIFINCCIAFPWLIESIYTVFHSWSCSPSSNNRQVLSIQIRSVLPTDIFSTIVNFNIDKNCIKLVNTVKNSFWLI